MQFSIAVVALTLLSGSSDAFQSTPNRFALPQINRVSCASQSVNSFSNITPFKTNNMSLNLSSITSEPPTVLAETMIEEPIETKKSFTDDGFVFGMEGSGLERPKGKVAQIVVEGDSTESSPFQIGLVSATFAAHIGLMALSVREMHMMNGDLLSTGLEATLLTLASWIIADLGSGVLHWSVDNYGNGKTPVMGAIIAAFQGHHAAPWTITERGFCNNVHKLCYPFGIPTMLLINAISGPEVTYFLAFFCMIEILSQEFHKWSHTTKKEVSPAINWLQDNGITIGRTKHAQHHMAPYAGNYCLISGHCNEVLDKSGFFRRLEHAIYNLNGIESNSMKLDEKLKERTLRGQYKLE